MNRFPALTGLRLFAATCIVLWHSQIGPLFKWGAFAPFYLAGAVPMFFVLSGFVLTIGARYQSWSDFFVARFARIWPTHIAALIFLFFILPSAGLEVLSQPGMGQRLFMNVLLIQAWSPDEATFWSYNAPAWSLSCEMFFYAVFPICIILLGRHTCLRLVALAIATFIFVILTQRIVPHINTGWLGAMNPFTGLFAFSTGVVAGTYFRSLKDARCGIAAGTVLQILALATAVGANAVFFSEPIKALPLGAAVLVITFAPAPFYALLLVALVRYDGLLSRALSIPIVVYGGEISYSVYLFHQILLRWYISHYKIFSAVPIWGQYCGIIVAILVTAAIVHHVVEEPARRRIVQMWLGSRSAARKLSSTPG